MTAFDNLLVPILTANEGQVVLELRALGLLPSEARCNHCGESMNFSKRNATVDKQVWKCNNPDCTRFKTTKSIRIGSFFERHGISLAKCYQIVYHWSTETPVGKSARETGISEPTTSKVYDHLRWLCLEYFVKNPVRFGGPGMTCKIDETCLSHKPKYHRGRPPASNLWAFGIVDVSVSPAIGYVELVDKRNSETLLPIIARVCRPGTIIHSDQWGAYAKIREKLGFHHYTVNHKEGFVNRETGVHTQEIESYWNQLKSKIKSMRGMRRDRIQAFLYEFMWRGRFRANTFESILNLIKEKYKFI
jgi:hypothetical protein